MTTPALPPGFELEPTQASSAPALPPGFEIIPEDDSSYGAGEPLEIDIVGGTPDSQYRDEFIARATDNMSGLDQFRAGIGKSLVDTAYGVGQQVATMGLTPARLGLGLASTVMPEQAAQAEQIISTPERFFQNKAAERRAIDADLMDTGAGIGGNVVGTAAQLIGPGAAIKGTAAARALLPTTIRGNIAQGAALGALQPSTSAGDQAINTSLGGLFGGLGAGLVKAAGGTINGLRNLLSRSGLTNAERRAGEIILRESTNPSGLTFEESAVPGVQRTLGESTKDPGLMALENTMRSRNRGAFDPLDMSNNAARVEQLQKIAGTDADMAAAAAARDEVVDVNLRAALREGDTIDAARGAQFAQDRTAAEAARNAAISENQRRAALGIRQQVSVPDVPSTMPVSAGLKDLRQFVSGAIDANAGRPSVQAPLGDVEKSLRDAGDSVSGLYLARKYVNDLLEGNAGKERSYAKAAENELMDIRDAISGELSKRSPSFPSYLDAYRLASKPINRMQVGQEIIGKSSGTVPDILGNPILTPAGVMKATTDLDAIAAKATGFKKAKASEILTPDDIASIKAIQEDMIRQAARLRPAVAGSPTAERQAIGDRIVKESIFGKVPVAGKIFEHYEKVADDILNEKLAFLIANPKHARRVIDALPKNDQKPVRQMLANLAMATSKSAGTKKEAVE